MRVEVRTCIRWQWHPSWQEVPKSISPDIHRIMEGGPFDEHGKPVLVTIRFEDGTVNQYRRVQ